MEKHATKSPIFLAVKIGKQMALVILKQNVSWFMVKVGHHGIGLITYMKNHPVRGQSNAPIGAQEQEFIVAKQSLIPIGIIIIL